MFTQIVVELKDVACIRFCFIVSNAIWLFLKKSVFAHTKTQSKNFQAWRFFFNFSFGFTLARCSHVPWQANAAHFLSLYFFFHSPLPFSPHLSLFNRSLCTAKIEPSCTPQAHTHTPELVFPPILALPPSVEFIRRFRRSLFHSILLFWCPNGGLLGSNNKKLSMKCSPLFFSFFCCSNDAPTPYHYSHWDSVKLSRVQWRESKETAQSTHTQSSVDDDDDRHGRKKIGCPNQSSLLQSSSSRTAISVIASST